MRRSAAALVLGVLAALAAAVPAEPLDIHGLSPRGTGGRVRASFAPPSDLASRDLRSATVTVRIADSPAEVLAKGARGYRVDRRGSRARYSAPRRASGPVRSFRLSVTGGTFDGSWKGLPLDFRNPPLVELRIGARVYRGGGTGGPDDPADDPPAVPDGPVAFETVVRGTAVLPAGAPAVPDAWLRSASDLAAYLQQFQSPPAFPAIDFATTTVAIVAGAPFEIPAWPWAVEVTGLASDDDAVTVSALAFFGPMGGPVTRPPGPLAQTVFVHAVTVPRAAAAVSFARTPEERADPWH